jgi:hypothetical protein
MTSETAAPPHDGTSSKLRQAITGPLLYLFILGDVLCWPCSRRARTRSS